MADWWTLSPRERQVLELAAAGNTCETSGRTLFIAPETVKHHRRNLLRKMGARNMAQAVALGYQQGLLGERAA